MLLALFALPCIFVLFRCVGRSRKFTFCAVRDRFEAAGCNRLNVLV